MSVQQIDWDLALIQKYNYSGPRYTSYPTALEFSEDFGEQAFLQAVARYPERPLSLYVHIPFCHKLCYFCGCNKIVTRQQHKADQYLTGGCPFRVISRLRSHFCRRDNRCSLTNNHTR